MPLQPAAPKRRAPKPAKHNWRYEDQQAYTAWAAAHPAEASIDAVWEPAEVVAVGTGSQGPVYLISWKGWEHEPALRSWHTTEDLRRYNWRPALLQHWAAGKPDRGAVAGM
ncbi:splicing factor spf30 isoform B [Chlorella sorokiniana]|uniref:Splicing factor spf30 isoform B n=1 Tax=Chlorella sorokiniana TaxID=3076 RepID=A0A2P6TC92_CHLSO|nr:splicing factor spf30 isoform B [Chlorella sorokiniana]|eukprot:PRW20248.1 splicing factor spf30 isoform B [Chlorella sorokiniana]